MDLVSYLETLPQEAVKLLYISSWTCQAVLKGLPPLAKLYVMRMTFLEDPISWGMIESWPRADGLGKHNIATRKLKDLQILQSTKNRQGVPMWHLQRDFKAHLRQAIIRGRVSGLEEDDMPLETLTNVPQRSELDRHSTKQWEALSLYLIGDDSSKPPSLPPFIGKKGTLNVDKLLQDARLLIIEDGLKEISEEGFRFLLLDTFHQLWVLIKQYIQTAALSGTRLSAVVGFLLQLGGQGFGKPMPLDRMDELQISIAADLAQLGLLLPFQTKDKKILISPTRLCLALTGAQSTQAHKEVTEGFIIVESNYRVVAYTSSALRISILQLFVHVDVYLPNCVIGTLTRQSVTEALKSGIHHEQIVQYLEQHAAPQVANDIPIVPAVVSDQIRLWQAETQRVQHFKAHLYDNFESDELYFETVQESRNFGTWLWQDDERKRLVALSEGHPALRDFIKASRQRLAC